MSDIKYHFPAFIHNIVKIDPSHIQSEDGSTILPFNYDVTLNSTAGTTRRINLSSYEQALASNDYEGEVIRVYLKEADAKGMIAWYDDFTTPGTPDVVAWVGAHYERNGVGGAPIHQHFSIETSTGTAGNIVTRLDIPYGAETINMRVTNANFNVAGGGIMAVSGAAETNRIVAWQSSTTDVDGNVTYASRFSVSLNTTAEAGSHAGSDLHFNRFNDDGTFASTFMTVKRSTGRIGINTAAVDINARLHITETADANVFRITSTHSGASNAALILLEGDNSADRIIQGRVTSDTVSRISLSSSGLLEWGAGGSSGRDTNLYRSGANILATDDKLLVALELEVDGDLNHDGSNVGFYGTAPVAKQTGVAVTAEGIHAALVNLGLISA